MYKPTENSCSKLIPLQVWEVSFISVPAYIPRKDNDIFSENVNLIKQFFFPAPSIILFHFHGGGGSDKYYENCKIPSIRVNIFEKKVFNIAIYVLETVV